MFTDFSELRSAVEANGGVLTVTMADLKDIIKAGRLGVHVRSNISQYLDKAGLGHAPRNLPPFQTELVRVYTQNTPAAQIIDLVENPSAEGDEAFLALVRQRPGRKAGTATTTKRRKSGNGRRRKAQPAAAVAAPSQPTGEAQPDQPE